MHDRVISKQSRDTNRETPCRSMSGQSRHGHSQADKSKQMADSLSFEPPYHLNGHFLAHNMSFFSSICNEQEDTQFQQAR